MNTDTYGHVTSEKHRDGPDDLRHTHMGMMIADTHMSLVTGDTHMSL